MAGRSPTKVSGNYASGIAFPVRADGDGGFNLSEGDQYIKDLVFSAVQPNYSDNPFQNIGGDDFPIFQVAGEPGWKLRHKQTIERVFKTLERENLAKLVKLKFVSSNDSGETSLRIQYVNLENATDGEITVGIEGQQSSGSASQIPGFLG